MRACRAETPVVLRVGALPVGGNGAHPSAKRAPAQPPGMAGRHSLLLSRCLTSNRSLRIVGIIDCAAQKFSEAIVVSAAEKHGHDRHRRRLYAESTRYALERRLSELRGG